MGAPRKMPAATDADLAAEHATVLHAPPGPPLRWGLADADPSAPDWCCAGCARRLLIAYPPARSGLLVQCEACGAVSRGPATQH